MYLISSNVTLWALLILAQIHLLKYRLFKDSFDRFCVALYTTLAGIFCLAHFITNFIT